MVFHRAKIKTLGTDVIMQNTSIQFVKSTKFLGVIIDNKLRWNDHIAYVKNKISKSLGILYKIRRYLDNTTLTNMYYSFVFPYLIYCVEIWESSLKSYLDPLVKIQKKMHQNYFLFGIFNTISEIKYFKLRKTRNTKNMFNDV